MELRKIFVYIMFILTGIVNIIASKCFEVDKAVGYGKYFNGEIIQTIGTIGFQQCQNICSERTNCLSTNYNNFQRTCELISTSTVSENIEQRIDYVFTQKETPNVCTEMQCKEGSRCLQTTKGTSVCLEEISSTTGETTSTPGETTSTPSETTSTPSETTSTTDETTSTPGETTSTPSETTSTTDETTSTPGETTSTPSETTSTTDETTSTPGETTNTPGETTSTPSETTSTTDETTSTTASNGPCERDCHDIVASSLSAKQVHQICPFGNEVPITVRCIAGGNPWTVIQRRIDGSENFDRNWNEYKSGFGNAAGEYWIGNDALHALTSSNSYNLYITLEDWSGNTAYASYSSFSVGNQASDFKLTVSGYTGNAGDSMDFSRGFSFSTKDKNPYTTGNGKTCVENHKSGWWHGHYVTWCAYANLNGVYGQRTNDMSTIYWWDWTSSFKPLKSCTMKIKRNT